MASLEEAAAMPQDRPQTRAEAALEALGTEQSKLHELIYELAHRLEGALQIRYSDVPENDSAIATKEEIVSPLVRRVGTLTTRARNAQAVVTHLLKNLEV